MKFAVKIIVILLKNIFTMKNTFKKSTTTFLFLLTLIFSLTFTSCKDKENTNAYAVQIQKADALFTAEKYEDAKTMYTKALELNKEETYPTEQIKKIDQLIATQKENNYLQKIQEADAFFNNKEYEKAKTAYEAASSIQPNESYPKTKLEEVAKATTAVSLANSKPFHIITGSFAINSNATAFQKSLTSKRIKSTILKSRNGNYLVSLNSFTTLTNAYNYLAASKNKFDTDVWVYKID